MPDYENIAAEIDKNQKKYIRRLGDAVAIPSISANPDRRSDVFRMIDWAQEQLSALGVKCQQIENGDETLPNGSKIKLPPVLFGALGEDKSKKTVLIYGHLDVQPAQKEDGWHTEPFTLTERDGKLFGRGSTDDKGPVIGWINAIEAMQSVHVDIPVNIKFILEGMEESGSLGLEEIIEKHKNGFLGNVDFVCISDNYWLGKRKPCITYGLRGIAYFWVEIASPKQDLHSGCFGGTIYEPMNDLVWLLGQLSDVSGKILIDGIYDSVEPLTNKEKAFYKNIDFDLVEYADDIGVKNLVSEDKEQILMNRWRNPSLSVHGIEGAFSGAGDKTVIPCKVTGKFSIRLVPNMDPKNIGELVEKYVNKLWNQRKSPSSLKFRQTNGGRPWVSDIEHPQYKCAAKALEKVYGVAPDFIREGGSIPVTLTLQNQLGKNVILLPMGACDDMAHSQNEKLNVSNYIEGTKAFAAYLLELGKL